MNKSNYLVIILGLLFFPMGCEEEKEGASASSSTINAPSSHTATAVSSSQINLSWTDSSPIYFNVTSYDPL